ncbi:MAG TPA: response regulator, partial [Bryobacteraceae bacterium]
TEHVLLVAAGGHTFAVSTSFVEGLERVKPSEIRNLNGRESIVIGPGPVSLVRLTAIVGASGGSAGGEGETEIPCVILNFEGKRAAVAVDRLVDEREAIIKDTGLPGSADLTAGAVPMEDGSVAVVLNVNGLMKAMDRPRRSPAVVPPTRKAQARKARILVVDDSLTTRSLEKSILEAHGYEVKLAVDGQEALERLRIEIPDLVISDVLMPRLTGFQLLEKMKSDDALKNIPVILVTSLESREEQHQGLSLGADAYIVKRKFDQRELLNLIGEII